LKLTYTLTFADYKAALLLHRRQKLIRRITFIILYCVVPGLAVVGLASVIIFEARGQADLAAEVIGFDAILIWLSVSLWAARFFNIRKGFKRIFPSTRTERSSSIDIDDERILSAIPGVSEGKFFWNAILAFAQDEKITLLYIDKNRFLLFPTYALTPVQRAELSALVERHIVRR
jgi:hypothetical protein